MRHSLFALGLVSIFVSVSSLTVSSQIFAHGNTEERVLFEPTQEGIFQAGKVSLSFDLFDKTQKKNLTNTDLDIVHEKLLHLFIFDPALKEYRHEHPAFNGQNWSVEVELPKNGRYWVYVQGKISADGSDFTSSNRLVVSGGLAANKPVPLIDTRTGTDGISRLKLPSKKFKAKQAEMITLKIDRTDGTASQLTEYLGALAHVLIVSDDGDSLIHAHPHMMGGELMVHTEFPAKGMYRVWTQFVDGGTLRTVALAVKVE